MKDHIPRVWNWSDNRKKTDECLILFMLWEFSSNIESTRKIQLELIFYNYFICLFQILPLFDADRMLLASNNYPDVLVGWNIHKRMVRCYNVPLDVHLECHLVGEQRRSQMGRQAIRCVSSPFYSVRFCENKTIFFVRLFLPCSNINPSQNPSVAIFAFGEGWHNYHHVFPWDYKTAELGDYRMNLTTAFIDLFAKIGWAYDLKSVSDEIIQKRVQRTGDGTHSTWGWGDKDQDKIEIEHATITHKKDE